MILNHNFNKILFLDMDGVVNSNHLIKEYIRNLRGLGYNDTLIKKQYNKDFNYCRELIFPELAAKITRICDETNCGIVWTSSWRSLPCYQDIKHAQEMLIRHNIPGNRLISYTFRHFSSCTRALEIKEWITEYGKNIQKFAILDDRDDARYNTLRCKFFQTTVENGITDEIANNVILWLNNLKK